MMILSRFRACLLIAAIICHGGIAAMAGTAEAEVSKPGKELKEKLAAAQGELGRAAVSVSQAAGAEGESLGENALESRELLSRIVRAYTRTITSQGSLAAEAQRSADLDREEAAWSGVGADGQPLNPKGRLPFPTPPPYSIQMVDELRESLQSVTQYSQTAAYTIALMNTSIADSTTNAMQAEAQLRQINEKLEASMSDKQAKSATDELAAQRDRLQLSIRAFQATKEMLEGELKLWKAKEDNLKRQGSLLARQIAAAASKVEFTQADLDKINAAGAAQSRKLDKELQRVLADSQRSQKALAEARQNLAAAEQASAGAGEAETERSAKIFQLKELVETHQIEAETVGLREEQLNQMQQLGELELVGWKQRFNAFGAAPKKAQEARTKLEASLAKIRIMQGYYREHADLNSHQLSDLEDYARNSSSASPASVKVAQEKLESFRVRDESYKQMLQTLERMERDFQRWSEELSAGLQTPATPKARMAGWFTGLGETVGSWWSYEIYKVVDPTFPGGLRPITVGKVVAALFILLVGYFICRLLAREMQRFLTRRMHLESNMAAIIRGWTLFFLTLGLVMIVMDWVKIPLTAFAFLGGALAIGMGFGTQNLLKNLISGIMLLIERPLRLGDLVEVGASRGKVVNIGIRSSVIRNADGIETLIPNSSFLESNVTNWTYSNPQVRFKIRVTVPFSTSTREVCELLTAVVEAHGQVNKNPNPQVLLEDFSEKGMVFCLFYWLEPLTDDAAAISSDLRFMIERRLSEAGILMC